MAFPTLALPTERIVAHLTNLVQRLAIAEEEQIRALHVEDLFLACAAADNVPGAMEIFHDRHQSVVAAAVRRIDSSAAFADDVYQLVVERLFVAAGDEPPRILSYAGRGPLRGWVAVAAQRIALSLRGADQVRASRDLEVVVVADLAAAGTDIAACDERERSIYVAAVREAISVLGDRERLLLRLTLAEGLSHQRVARIYGVNQSTVTRWITAAIDTVREETYRHIVAALGIGRGDVESIARSLLSRLDVTLSLMLGAPDTDPQGARRKNF